MSHVRRGSFVLGRHGIDPAGSLGNAATARLEDGVSSHPHDDGGASHHCAPLMSAVRDHIIACLVRQLCATIVVTTARDTSVVLVEARGRRGASLRHRATHRLELGAGAQRVDALLVQLEERPVRLLDLVANSTSSSPSSIAQHDRMSYDCGKLFGCRPVRGRGRCEPPPPPPQRPRRRFNTTVAHRAQAPQTTPPRHTRPPRRDTHTPTTTNHDTTFPHNKSRPWRATRTTTDHNTFPHTTNHDTSQHAPWGRGRCRRFGRCWPSTAGSARPARGSRRRPSARRRSSAPTPGKRYERTRRRKR